MGPKGRIARFGRTSQRFSRERSSFSGPAGGRLSRQGMGLRSRLIPFLKSSGLFRIAVRTARQFTPATIDSSSVNGPSILMTTLRQSRSSISGAAYEGSLPSSDPVRTRRSRPARWHEAALQSAPSYRFPTFRCISRYNRSIASSGDSIIRLSRILLA